MPSFTPAQIVDELHKTDVKLDELSTQYAWFKAQRDFWRGRLDFAIASAKVLDDGPVSKSKEAAMVSVAQTKKVEVPWLDGTVMSLPDFVATCDASFDLISKRYEYMHDHLMTAMAVNKNVMQAYNAFGRDPI